MVVNELELAVLARMVSFETRCFRCGYPRRTWSFCVELGPVSGLGRCCYGRLRCDEYMAD